MENTNICCICLEEIQNNISFFDCSHNMHEKCINTWIDTNLNKDKYPRCPLCKQDCNYNYLMNYIINNKKENFDTNNINYTPYNLDYQNIIIDDSLDQNNNNTGIQYYEIANSNENLIYTSQINNLIINNNNLLQNRFIEFNLYYNFNYYCKISLLYLGLLGCFIYFYYN